MGQSINIFSCRATLTEKFLSVMNQIEFQKVSKNSYNHLFPGGRATPGHALPWLRHYRLVPTFVSSVGSEQRTV